MEEHPAFSSPHSRPTPGAPSSPQGQTPSAKRACNVPVVMCSRERTGFGAVRTMCGQTRPQSSGGLGHIVSWLFPGRGLSGAFIASWSSAQGAAKPESGQEKPLSMQCPVALAPCSSQSLCGATHIVSGDISAQWGFPLGPATLLLSGRDSMAQSCVNTQKALGSFQMKEALGTLGIVTKGEERMFPFHTSLAAMLYAQAQLGEGGQWQVHVLDLKEDTGKPL